jgi:hypothetical protein
MRSIEADFDRTIIRSKASKTINTNRSNSTEMNEYKKYVNNAKMYSGGSKYSTKVFLYYFNYLLGE